eukprot:scaffold11899_cov133-Isochrysis_galbana.AAC.1
MSCAERERVRVVVVRSARHRENGGGGMRGVRCHDRPWNRERGYEESKKSGESAHRLSNNAHIICISHIISTMLPAEP